MPQFRPAVLGVLALYLAMVAAVPAGAQQAGELRVATRVLPPMVTEQGGRLSGFSIELWDQISERLKLQTRYQAAPDIRALLEAVSSGNADLGIAAISITAEREARFDFSQPIMNAGLQILVRSEGTDTNPLVDLLRNLFSATSLLWLGIAVSLSLIPAHLLWLSERGKPGGLIPGRGYLPGIFEALYWTTSTLTAQGDNAPINWLARALAVLWKFAAVAFIAFYTAQLTATLTVQHIQGAINGPEDLGGKRVGATRGSTAVTHLRGYQAQIREFPMIGDAYRALLDKQLDAVVFDAPVLLYYAANEGKGRVQLVGNVFNREDYGIVFPSGSRLRKQVNEALLAMKEDGTYGRLYDKWFGRQG